MATAAVDLTESVPGRNTVSNLERIVVMMVYARCSRTPIGVSQTSTLPNQKMRRFSRMAELTEDLSAAGEGDDDVALVACVARAAQIAHRFPERDDDQAAGCGLPLRGRDTRRVP